MTLPKKSERLPSQTGTCLANKTRNGTFQPPRNSVVASIETVNMLMYSALKNSANFIALYSV